MTRRGLVRRALAMLTGSAAPMTSWRPAAFGPELGLPIEAVLAADDAPSDGSSADLRARQRELAFEMYGEALERMAEADRPVRRSRRSA